MRKGRPAGEWEGLVEVRLVATALSRDTGEGKRLRLEGLPPMSVLMLTRFRLWQVQYQGSKAFTRCPCRGLRLMKLKIMATDCALSRNKSNVSYQRSNDGDSA
jgi:hypothetical protein